MRQKREGRIAAWYKRFRASKYFLLALITFIISWIILHFIEQGFDPDWGTLNLILSTEASIGMGVFMMISDKQDSLQRAQLQYMLDLLEAQRTLLETMLPNHSHHDGNGLT